MFQALIELLKSLVKLSIFLMLTIALALALSFPMNWLFYWLLQPLKLLGMPESLLSDLRLTGRLEFITTPFSFVPAVLIAALIMTRKIERRPFITLGLRATRWAKELGTGAVLALAGMLPVLTLVAFVAPYFPTTPPPEAKLRADLQAYASAPSEWLAVGLVVGFVVFIWAFFEELIFRGYAFQVLMAAIGKWPAALVLSALFALAHFQSHATAV